MNTQLMSHDANLFMPQASVNVVLFPELHCHFISILFLLLLPNNMTKQPLHDPEHRNYFVIQGHPFTHQTRVLNPILQFFELLNRLCNL